MLTVVEELPDGLLTTPAAELHRILEGPTLIHLAGQDKRPLFVSALQHGNEDVGLVAVQELLKKYTGKTLPRSLSIFIANVAAAREGVRFLEGQPDYNRIWPGSPLRDCPEQRMMADIIEDMQQRRVFASIDLHNNTGYNPFYACVNRLDHRFLRLASLFSRTVVYFIRPLGVQSMAFADICPAVTLECGKVGDRFGLERAVAYLEACLHLESIPDEPVATAELDLFHTIAVVKVPDNVTFSFDDDSGVDLRFVDGFEYYNFKELSAGTPLARVLSGQPPYLDVRDERGMDVADQFFRVHDQRLCLTKPVMPSMLTTNKTVVRQDCLCYLMERYPFPSQHLA